MTTKAYFKKLESLLLFSLCSFAVVACSDGKVNVTPRYKPSILAPYDYAGFAEEWQKTTDLPDAQLDVFRDLIARYSEGFDYEKIWEGFANRSLHLPTNDEVWALILDEAIPICHLETFENFNRFAYSLLPDHPFAFEVTHKALGMNCPNPVELSTYENMAARLLDRGQNISEINRIALLQDLLNRVAQSSSYSSVLEARMGWDSYFERHLMEKSSKEEVRSGIESLFDSYDLNERRFLRTQGEPGLIASLSFRVGNFDHERMTRMASRWGVSASVRFVQAHYGGESFANLDPNQKRQFIRSYSELLLRLESPDVIEVQRELLTYFRELHPGTIVNDHLGDLSRLIDEFGFIEIESVYREVIRPQQIEEANAETRSAWLKFLLNLELTDPIEKIAQIYSVFDYLKSLPVKEVVADYLTAFDGLVLKSLQQIRERPGDFDQKVHEALQVRRYPGLSFWLRFQLDNFKEIAAFGTFSPMAALDEWMLHRTNVRALMSNRSRYFSAVQFLCEFLEEQGFPSKHVSEGNLEKLPALLSSSRACVFLESSSEPVSIEFLQNTQLSPDAYLFTEGRSVEMKSTGSLSYAFVDVSPDGIDPEIPEVEILDPPEEHHAMSFPIVLGYEIRPKEFLFFPMHYIARERLGPFDSETDLEAYDAIDGPEVSVSIIGSLKHSFFKSAGSEGRPGALPVWGGFGDQSFPYRENIDLIQRLEGIYLGTESVKMAFDPQPGELRLRRIRQDIARLVREGKEDSIFVDDRYLASTDKEGNFETYIDSSDFDQFKIHQKEVIAAFSDQEIFDSCKQLWTKHIYFFLTGGETAQLDESNCRYVFALREMTKRAISQLLGLPRPFSEQEQLVTYEIYENETALPVTAGRPGMALPAGHGGEIQIQAAKFETSYGFAQGGQRYMWPDEWIGNDRTSKQLQGIPGEGGACEFINWNDLSEDD